MTFKKQDLKPNQIKSNPDIGVASHLCIFRNIYSAALLEVIQPCCHDCSCAVWLVPSNGAFSTLSGGFDVGRKQRGRHL